MSEWLWVAVGFLVAYGSILGHFALLHRSRARVQRQADNLR